MPTDLENLLTARSNLYAQLANTPVKPTYNIDGQMVDRNGWERALLARIEMLNKQITLIQGPFEIVTKGVSG